MAYGVPQVSVMGPVLFVLSINNLTSLIQNGRVIQYADGTTLCIKADMAVDLEIKSLVDIFQTNLKTNISKSNFA